MRFDLHVHSTASDGHLSPSELVRASLEAGLTALAITDHDSLSGVPEALQAARGTDLLVIAGVELSASYEDADIHILGYFVDPHDKVLTRRLSTLREVRHGRAHQMVEHLKRAGIDVTLEAVLHFAQSGSVGRSHVARALLAGGHVASVAEAFDTLIGRGRPYYVPKPVAHPVDVVRSIAEAGGVPVLAHPGVTGANGCIPELVEAGLVGLEAYHGEHSLEQREYYVNLARSLELIVTGGSDFHGLDAPGSPLGGVEMPESVLHELLEAAGRTWTDGMPDH
ncbi:MAG: PHP domain-containing protein [Coriobacteriia bacterium]|nr:PHP domain-containing protein [Coriobacteriia bacterium]